MTWDERVLRSVERSTDLNDALRALFAQQRETWPALVEGKEALQHMPMRVLQTGQAALLAQANVRRSASTFARTDAASVARRACFLCLEHLPAPERAVAFDDLVLMPNPFPAVKEHLTIAAPAHVPQRLASRVGNLHRLTEALGCEYFVLYNGPRCGASAPDHFHFQSGAVDGVPIFSHPQIDRGKGLQVLRAGARGAFHLRHHDHADACTALHGLLEALPTQDDEPMVNVLATRREGHYVTLVFPRHKHRSAGFDPGGGGLAISPAGLEMAGIVVVADEDQFEQVDAAQVEAIFCEVCWSADAVEAML